MTVGELIAALASSGAGMDDEVLLVSAGGGVVSAIASVTALEANLEVSPRLAPVVRIKAGD